MTHPLSKRFPATLLLLFVLPLVACNPGTTPVSVPTLTPTSLTTPTETVIPPAISVNGEGITTAELDAEVARYQQAQSALGNTVSLETATQAVTNDLVDTLLLEQGAAGSGYTVDDATLQAHIDALAAQLGGADALAAWQTAHGYTETDFRLALRLQIAAAWMRDQLAAAVPGTAEQVHVEQILLYNMEDAQKALNSLDSGVNFPDLAAQYDPVTKGELGWFPRGYLPSAAIEEAAFALQPGQYSAIIQDETGYHILYVVERDPARQLSPDALLKLQQNALQSWLAQRKNESTILIAP
jgi:peptidyl-prolyl cis-trans isomerase C